MRGVSDFPMRAWIAGLLALGLAAASAAGTAPASAAVPIDAALQTHALAVLPRHIGPTARIVVRRAAEQARSPEQFDEQLLASAAETERPALAQEMQPPA